jgi:hypothetical protein
MRRSLQCLGCILVFLPVVVFATDFLPQSLDRADRALRLSVGDELLRAEERGFEESEDLFPAVGEVSGEESALDRVRSDRTAAFVTVQVDGRMLALRDVPRQSWFAPYVRDAAERGLVSGYRDVEGNATGLFGPEDNVTVEQLGKIVILGKRMDTTSCPASKNLTASGSWSLSILGCAEAAGWALFADGSIDVHRFATRSEVLVTLMQAFEVPYPEVIASPFEDVPVTMQFAGYIARAKDDGVVAGYTGEDGMLTGFFGPADPVTRAETAKMVTLAVQEYGQ